MKKIGINGREKTPRVDTIGNGNRNHFQGGAETKPVFRPYTIVTLASLQLTGAHDYTAIC